MKVESMTLLKTPPAPQGGSPSKDFVLGEVSDGVLLVGELPSDVSLGLFVELIYLPKEHGSHTIELFAKEVGGEDAWLLATIEIEIPDLADGAWQYPLNLPLPFAIELEVDRDDMDLLLVVIVDDNPDALKNLFLRPDVPEPDDFSSI